MYSGAAAACRKIKGIPFYFENHSHKVIFLHDFSSMDCIKIPNIDRFFQINDFKIFKKGHWSDDPSREKRLHITNFLWEKREIYKSFTGNCAKITMGRKALHMSIIRVNPSASINPFPMVFS